MSASRLVFVYNADSGLFNTLTDIAHKAFSPSTYQCSLCAITHDLLHEKSEWKQFIASLSMDTEFLHRDEFHKAYSVEHESFPAIFIANGNALELVVGSEELASLGTVEALKQRVDALIDARETG